MEVPIFIVVVVALAFLAILFQNSKLKSALPEKALELFESFKRNELDSYKKELNEALKKDSKAELELWKIKNETSIRQDAINRSHSVILGKVSEHAVPFHAQFPFNPKDLRFVGSPIDMIVFDGADEEKQEIEIHFLEIKTGNSQMSRKQKLIRDAVISGRVHWRELRI